MKKISLAFCVSALFSSLPAIVGAQGLPSQVLTERGDLVSLQHSGGQSDPLGEPEDSSGEGDADSESGLSLVVRSSEGEVNHWLVDETAESVTARGVLYQEDLGLVFAVWESHEASGRMQLHVAAHDGDGWIARRSFPDDVGSLRGSALLAATRKSMSDGKIDARLHVAALVDGSDGDQALPHLWILRLDSSIDLRSPASFDLAALLEPAAADEETSVVPGELLLLKSGAERSEVLLGVTDAASSQLLVVRVEPVSDDLAELADEARAQIIRVGATAPSVEELSRAVIEYVEQAAAVVTPGLGGYMAYEVERILLEGEPEDDSALVRAADEARAQITRVGLRPRVLHGPARFEPRFHREVSTSDDGDQEEGDIISVQLMATWPLPEHVPGGSLLFLSTDGRRGLFAAIRDGAVLVIQGTQGEWSEVENLGEADVLVDLTELLQRRVEWASEAAPVEQ